MKRYTTAELQEIIRISQAEIDRRSSEDPVVITNRGAMFFKNLRIVKKNKSSLILEDSFGNQYINRTTRFTRENGSMKHYERLTIENPS